MSQPHERLADEREHGSSGIRVAVMLALTFGLVLGVNAWASWKSPAAQRTYDGLTVGKKWELASAGAPAGGVVVVGDSGGNFAVQASTLGEALGVPVVNLCTYGRFLMTGARWMLDRAVTEAKAPPALALVIIGSQTLVLVNPKQGFTLSQIPVSLATAASAGASLTAMDLVQVAVARAFPLFVQAGDFGRRIQKRIDITVDAAVREAAFDFDPSRLPIAADGTSTILSHYPDGIPANVEAKILPEIRAFEGPIPRHSDRVEIERMVRDAESRGYDLVFVDGPIWEGLVGHPEQIELMRQFHDYLDAICSTSDHAWHLPGPQQTFVKEDMENAFHLMPAAAQRFTVEIGRRLKVLGLPRPI